jgi:preprotein translocase subunit SecE
MAAVTTSPDADDDEEDRQEQTPSKPKKLEYTPAGGAVKTVGGGGMGFAIYKPGQGYWTRMCTAGAVALILAMFGYWISENVVPRISALNGRSGISAGAIAALMLVIIVFLWRYLNRPKIVDFLVETEKEMGKVNWTDKTALLGSTRVVIIFVVVISLVLFLYDLMFGYFFNLIGILKVGPLG